MIKCGECGYENMDGLDYCDGCGAKLAASPVPAAEPAAAPPEAPPTPVAATVVEAAPVATAAAASAPVEAPAASRAPTGELNVPSPAAEPPPAVSAAGAPFKAKLAIIRGGRRGQEFELEADDPEAKVSRKHALIRIEGGKLTVEDIGSLNGTFVNRQPRLQPGNPAELKDGDEIIIGKTFLKLTVSPIS